MIVRRTTDEAAKNSNAMLGLSGLDTAAMLKAMMKPYRNTISAISQKQQVVIWRQERYRELIGKLNDFRSTFFDYRNPKTNITSPGVWKQFIVENPDPNGDYVRISSTTNTKPGSGTIEILEMPTPSVITGASGLVKPVRANMEPMWAAAASLGQSVSINMDGIVRTIFITNDYLSGDPVARLQGAINAAFGADRINVELVDFSDSDPRQVLQFTANAEKVNQFIIMDSSARSNLGFGVDSNLSNKVSVTDTLYALNNRLNSSFAFISHTDNMGTRNVVEFTINGVNFRFNEQDSLKNIMDTINGSAANVKIAYDSRLDRFTLTADICGPGDTLNVNEPASNFLAALGLVSQPAGSFPAVDDPAPIRISGGHINPYLVDIINAADPPYRFDVTVNGVTKSIVLKNGGSPSPYASGDDVLNDVNAKLAAAFPGSGIKIGAEPTNASDLSQPWELVIDIDRANAANPVWEMDFQLIPPLKDRDDLFGISDQIKNGLTASALNTITLPGGLITVNQTVLDMINGASTPHNVLVLYDMDIVSVVLDKSGGYADVPELIADINAKMKEALTAPNGSIVTLGVSDNGDGTYNITLAVDRTVTSGAWPWPPVFDMASPSLGVDYFGINDLRTNFYDAAYYNQTLTVDAGRIDPSLAYLIDSNAGSPSTEFKLNVTVNAGAGDMNIPITLSGPYAGGPSGNILADVNAQIAAWLSSNPIAGVSAIRLEQDSPGSNWRIAVDTKIDVMNAPVTVQMNVGASPIDDPFGVGALRADLQNNEAALRSVQINGGILSPNLVADIVNTGAPPYAFIFTINGVTQRIVLETNYANDPGPPPVSAEQAMIDDVNAKLNVAFPDSGVKLGLENAGPTDVRLVAIFDKSAPNAAYLFELELDASGQTIPSADPDPFGILTLRDKFSYSTTDASYTEGSFGRVVINGVVLQVDRKVFEFEGVLFELKKETELNKPIEYNIRTDTDKIVSLIMDFIEGYNEVVRSISDALGEKRDRDYHPLTDEQKEEMSEREIDKWEGKAKAGLLRGDAAFIGLSSKLRLSFYNPVYEKYEDNKVIPFSLKKMGIDTQDSFSGYNPKSNGILYVDEMQLRHAIETNLDEIVYLFTKPPEKYEMPMKAPGDPGYDEYIEWKNRPAEWHARMQRLYDDKTGGLTTKLLNILNDYIKTVGGKGILLQNAGMENDFSDLNNAMTREIFDYNTRINAAWARYDRIERQKLRTLSRLEVIVSNAGSQMQWMQSQLFGNQQ